MNYLRGSDRGEVLLLPEALEDYIASENPVRFIDAFVEQLDLGKAGFANAQLNETGRPPYDPGDLLRLYLYGYLNRVRSSRGLEREAARNLEVIWLLRKLRPGQPEWGGRTGSTRRWISIPEATRRRMMDTKCPRMDCTGSGWRRRRASRSRLPALDL